MKKLRKHSLVIGTTEQLIKANRKASREEEIALYGHPICWKKVWKDKSLYTRKLKHRNHGYN